jgi:TolB-like protein
MFFDAYRKGNYRGALDAALKINLPGHIYTSAVTAAAHAQLGEREAARTALRQLLTQKPEFAATAREEFGRWFDAELTSHLIDGLRKAGLDIASADAAVVPDVAVVVLPFINRSPDPGNEYFSDGLTEEIITDLSRIAALRVISRNSSMALKGTTNDTHSIVKQLGVTHLVSGSVRRVGDDLRVTAELIEGVSDSPLWSEKYSGTMADVFGIQEEIAQKIVLALKVTLTEREARQVAERPIENPVAYDCYLRARQEMYAWTPEASRRALRLVDDALAIVGDTPLLLATKAQLYWNEVNTGQVPAGAGLDRAADFVGRALALAPDFPLAIFVRGLVAGSRGQPERALPDLYRAHELWPGDANIVAEFCRFSNSAGLRNKGEFVDRLVQVDPLTPVTPLVVCAHHILRGQYLEAAIAARRAIEMAPVPSMLHVLAAWTIAEAGFAEEACQTLGRVGTLMGDTVLGSWALFLKHAREGNVHQALSCVTPEVEQAMMGNEFTSRTVVHGYALLGRADDAFRWLRTAIDRGFINYPSLERDQFLGSLRDDPRFRQLMDEVRPRWEAVVAWERSR